MPGWPPPAHGLLIAASAAGGAAATACLLWKAGCGSAPALFAASLAIFFAVATVLLLRKKMRRQDAAARIGDNAIWCMETLDAITDMITIIDTDFTITYANLAARKGLGLEATGNRAAKCYVYHHGMEAPPEGCPSCSCIASRTAATFERFEPHLNKHIEIRALPRIDHNGRMTGLVHVIRDISDRKQIESRMNLQLERLRALRMIDITISSSLDLRLTLEMFLEQVKSQLKADAACVLLYEPAIPHLRCVADKGFLTDRIRNISHREGESIALRSIMTREKIIIPDLNSRGGANTGELVREFTESYLVRDEQFRAYCGIPLVAKGNVNGVLEVFHRSVFSHDEDWTGFLEALAGQAAIAIDNAALFRNLQQSRDNLMIAYDMTIEGWAMALDLRDRETEGHSRRVSKMTVRVASEIGVPEHDLLHIKRGALLHDIGKLGVPDAVLFKNGKLDETDWAIMKQHPSIAYHLMARIPFLEKAVDIPYCHHERWDGTGYPRGLKGTEIPFSARIFAVVDIWDALCSDRPYRKAWSKDEVVEHISALSGSHLDPGLVEVFLKTGVD